MSPELREAHRVLFQRYLDIIGRREDAGADPKTSVQNCAWMCRTALDELDTLPVDKLSRWLGFVQGVLATLGLIRVDTERDFSRPLFHAAYRQDGNVPPTRERS